MKDDAATRRHGDTVNRWPCPNGLRVPASPCLRVRFHPSSFMLVDIPSARPLYSFTIYKTPTWEKEPDEVDYTRTVCGCSDDRCRLQ
jgi:hypothetical protein